MAPMIEFHPVLEAGVPVGEWVVYNPAAGWWEGGTCYSSKRCHARRFWSMDEARAAWRAARRATRARKAVARYARAGVIVEG